MLFYPEGWRMRRILKVITKGCSADSRGFSLVELMVALLFTSLLMAGLASVFKSSMSTFVTSGEKISSTRRNRLAVDMMFDDLNAAGMLLTSLSDYGGTSSHPINLNAANPAFRIIPNVKYLKTDVASPNNVSDTLDLYFDEALPFEGTVGVTNQNVAQLLADEVAVNTAITNTISLSSEQTNLVASENVKSPLSILFRADVASAIRPETLVPNGSGVDVTLGTNFRNANSGPTKTQIPAGTPALFVKPGIYARYSIQPVNLDPDPANTGLFLPCLVRDEVRYSAVSGSANPFAAPMNRVVVAENVIGFQVMVSPDGGLTWINNPYDSAQRKGALPSDANPGIPHTKFAVWDDLRTMLNADASITGRPAPFNTVDDGRFWFKDIPITVRVDITTRTARPRGEYIANTSSTIINGTSGIPYKIQTQSIVLVPRHSGLSYGGSLL